MTRTVRIAAFCAAFILFVALMVAPAFAWDESQPIPDGWNTTSVFSHNLADCVQCHDYGAGCEACHDISGTPVWQGPHGDYAVTTNKCEACHTVHSAPLGSVMLLPAATIIDTCQTCHDGTGGSGVYGAIEARTGVQPGGGHRVGITDQVPGGDALTGGLSTVAFSDQNGFLTCTDCHSPHGSDMVEPFTGERQRVESGIWRWAPSYSSRLLRKQPTSATASVSEYGSDWCLACHKGRSNSGPTMNHPVDSVASTTTPFYYDNLAILNSDAPTGVTVLGQMAIWGTRSETHTTHANPAITETRAFNRLISSRGFLMPYPRTAQQTGHAPICQQCHEDSRFVGSLSADGLTADAATVTITNPDGITVTDNPRFQNFPHETLNASLLVETNDDLCLNCHPASVLP